MTTTTNTTGHIVGLLGLVIRHLDHLLVQMLQEKSWDHEIELWESICIQTFEMPHEETFMIYIFANSSTFSGHWHDIVDKYLYFKCLKRNRSDYKVCEKIDSCFESIWIKWILLCPSVDYRHPYCHWYSFLLYTAV